MKYDRRMNLQYSKGKMMGPEISMMQCCIQAVATMVLKGSAVVSLVNAIVPLYISIGLGYTLSKLKVLTYEQHYAGVVSFCFKVTTAPLVFQMVAANNPYSLNLRLIGADTLCKFMVLLVLSLSCYWRPTAHHVAWVSAYFNLATMSNTVLVGIPLVTALYPGTEKDITAIVFMQCLLWFSVCIFILELHKVLLEKNPEKGNEQGGLELDNSPVDLEKDEKRFTRSHSHTSGHEENETRRSSSVTQINRTQSATASVQAPAPPTPTPLTEPREIGHQHLHINALQANGHGVEARGCSRLAEPAAASTEASKLSRLHVVNRILVMVGLKFVRSPIVWSSLLGFVYALLNFKFNHGKPLPVILKSTVSLLANCTLGMAMFMLGMHMAEQKKLLACGIYNALWGAVIRFFVSPAVMAVASLIVGLRGETFRFAVLQAMIPQAITSFVFASNYKVHEDIFSTAVWFQTLLFFPFAIALYSMLNIGA